MSVWTGRASRASFTVIGAVIALVSCSKEEPPPPPPAPPRPAASAPPPVVKVERSLLAVFAPLPAAPDWKSSPPAKSKVELGRMLFHDKRLSTNQDLSCSKCHNLATFGVDSKAFSIGEGEKPTERNTPSLYDSAISATQLWDGRVETMEARAWRRAGTRRGLFGESNARSRCKRSGAGVASCRLASARV